MSQYVVPYCSTIKTLNYHLVLLSHHAGNKGKPIIIKTSNYMVLEVFSEHMHSVLMNFDYLNIIRNWSSYEWWLCGGIGQRIMGRFTLAFQKYLLLEEVVVLKRTDFWVKEWVSVLLLFGLMSLCVSRSFLTCFDFMYKISQNLVLCLDFLLGPFLLF